jgi:hypothetical protein
MALAMREKNFERLKSAKKFFGQTDSVYYERVRKKFWRKIFVGFPHPPFLRAETTPPPTMEGRRLKSRTLGASARTERRQKDGRV